MAAGETGGGGQQGGGNNIPSGFMNGGQGVPAAQPTQGRGRVNELSVGVASPFDSGFNVDARPVVDRQAFTRQPVAERQATAADFAEFPQAHPLAQREDMTEETPQEDDGTQVIDSDQARLEMDQRQAQWAEWDKSDDLAQPLQQKLVNVTVNGQDFRIPVSEAISGYMMQSDYTDKLRQVYELRDQVLNAQRAIQGFLTQLDGGQSFLDTMIHIGKFKGFSEAAIMYGTQLAAEQAMSPEQREVLGAKRAAEARAYKFMMENRALQAQLQQSQQPQVSRTETYYMNQLRQMIPLAIERMGRRGVEWVDSPFARNLFEQHWATLIQTIDGKDLTSQFVENALIGVMQHIQKLAAAGHIQLPQASASQAMPMGQLSGPTRPMGNGQNGRQIKRERITDMGRMVGR